MEYADVYLLNVSKCQISDFNTIRNALPSTQLMIIVHLAGISTWMFCCLHVT